jgi:hypothetical protein
MEKDTMLRKHHAWYLAGYEVLVTPLTLIDDFWVPGGGTVLCAVCVNIFNPCIGPMSRQYLRLHFKIKKSEPEQS